MRGLWLPGGERLTWRAITRHRSLPRVGWGADILRQSDGARRIPLLTIGYEGVTLNAFLDALQAAGVETLVDVRQMPLSESAASPSAPWRKRSVVAVSIMSTRWNWVARARFATCTREDGSWANGGSTVGYLAHLATQAQAVDRVVFRALRSRCALLCFEADYRVCHRRYVADAAAERSSRFEIQHLDLVTRTGAAALAAPRRVGR